jgi:hypothetical protein
LALPPLLALAGLLAGQELLPFALLTLLALAGLLAGLLACCEG